MRSSPLLLSTLLTITLLSPQTAHAAAPPFPKKAGKLATTACPEPPLSSGGIPRTREYLDTVVKCLDTSWSAYFARTGTRFEPPAVRYAEEGSVCGVPVADVDAFYCHPAKTLVFPLTGRWIEGRTDLYPFKVAAHEYGHHLQTLTGIRRSYEARYRAEPNARAELRRRFELQADCLAGVFLGSVRGSLARTGADWSALYEAVRASGDDGERRSHGRGAGRVGWFKRGLAATSPAACDTWSAPAAKVS
ncbi:neutral zinc metallopeptidase [Nonomuraea gerenzanensis]|uniref:YpfJ protein, zinc metalloprotease superfamily n=1 Tax=Nonomuraea gerenzanensis TaxID=93944 RepID=A0A1M4EJX5_9ACTN|nr:neutral zinc metallopeptidase [Nonomuraea gerenzanensis]UBU10725.1 neutral zinc metallopeptidase [Nonomuraea gerenzanensis]SBO99150.1 YpfJ protein, zinc metalloprotease superfamily [Nonomuraea gerenzanensis]